MQVGNRSTVLNVSVHVICWLAFIFLPLFIISEPMELLNSSSVFVWSYIISCAILLIIFYFNYLWVIPQLFVKKKYVQWILITVAFFACIVLVHKLLIPKDFSEVNGLKYLESRIMKGLILKTLATYLISWLIFFAQSYRNKELAVKRAELAQLKSQVNPHFLFNSLNSIYSQAMAKSDQTAESVAQLSDIMRYVTDVSEKDSVSLSEELEYVRNYVDLQRIRLTQKTSVKFEIQGDSAGKRIPPLLFINFVENAFKYGVSNETEGAILFKFTVTEKELELMVENNKAKQVKSGDKMNSSGIKNAKKRLDLLYGLNYFLEIKESDVAFRVDLKVPLL